MAEQRHRQRPAAAAASPATASASAIASSDHTRLTRMATQLNSNAPVQRYARILGNIDMAESRTFAVQNAGQANSRLFKTAGQPLPEFQHMRWESGGDRAIDGIDMTEVNASFDNQAAMNEMFCGKFSESITGIAEKQENGDAPPGRSLFTNLWPEDDKTTALWSNHYAPVVLADENGDRATLETAVGLDRTWFDIYGTRRDQSFFVKTQIANMMLSIERKLGDEATYRTILSLLKQYVDHGRVELDEQQLAIAGLHDIAKHIEQTAARPPLHPDGEVPRRTVAPRTQREHVEALKEQNRDIRGFDGFDGVGGGGLSPLALFAALGVGALAVIAMALRYTGRI